MTRPAERDRTPLFDSGRSRQSYQADAAAERGLLSRLAHNDRQALSELFDRTAPRLYAVLLRWVTSRNDANSILEKVFTQLWEDRHTASSANDRPLLALIESARQLAIKGGFSRLGVREDRPGPSWSTGPPAVERPSSGADRDLLKEIYFDGGTVTELASRHGLSSEAFRDRLIAAMHELRRELKAEK